jgi:hypothetical protein
MRPTNRRVDRKFKPRVLRQIQTGADTWMGTRKMTERERIEARLREYAAAAAAGSQQRLASYKPSIENVFQCPRCWVERAEQRPLHGVSRGGHDDVNECRACGGGFDIPSDRPF